MSEQHTKNGYQIYIIILLAAILLIMIYNTFKPQEVTMSIEEQRERAFPHHPLGLGNGGMNRNLNDVIHNR